MMDIEQEVAKMFSYGIACQALIALEQCGILLQLKNNILLEFGNDNEFVNANAAVEAALIALTYSGCISKNNRTYFLTSFGKAVLETFSEFLLWFGAYRLPISNAGSIMSNKHTSLNNSIDSMLVANASAEIGKNKVDPFLQEIFTNYYTEGALCDLGCGNGLRLLKLCQRHGCEGLGIDISHEAIHCANANLKEFNAKNVYFECNDVTRLEEHRKSVSIFMQTFMTHHILPRERCIQVLSDYKIIFPNSKYFIVLDTVTQDEQVQSPEIFSPGFLFIHGLQGLIPRSKSELIKIFNLAGYEVLQEVKLAVPNSYIWVLKC